MFLIPAPGVDLISNFESNFTHTFYKLDRFIIDSNFPVLQNSSALKNY